MAENHNDVVTVCACFAYIRSRAAILLFYVVVISLDGALVVFGSFVLNHGRPPR